MLRISLTGPEAAGKSTLTAQLAAHFGAGLVPEYARVYLAQHGPAYTLPDLENIAHGQLAAEDAAATQHPDLLFCDTDLTVSKIWTENAFGTCPQWIEDALRRPRYALTLLLAPDLPWVPDPLREHPNPADRWRFHGQYRQTLQALGWPFVEISGAGGERLAQAIMAVTEQISEGFTRPRPDSNK